MGLRAALTRTATRRPHVLVAEVPGSASTRIAVEQAMAERGWPLAASPADADVLLVCGSPGDDLLEPLNLTWDQLPGPRARVSALTLESVEAALDEAVATLSDDEHQRTDARSRRNPNDMDMDDSSHDMDMDDSSHDMDMDMDMPSPGGIPLAGSGQDRDGLDLDVLHVSLGPVLASWPAGLVLRCVMQGDVVTRARVEVVSVDRAGDAAASSLSMLGDRGVAAACCDSAARLLDLAGWAVAAGRARRAREALLGCVPDEQCQTFVQHLHRSVARSRALRWSLRGLGTLGGEAIAEQGLPAVLGGDVRDRLLVCLDRAGAALTGGSAALPRTPEEESAVLHALPDLVEGLELAAVRLVVASLDPDVASMRRDPVTADSVTVDHG